MLKTLYKIVSFTLALALVLAWAGQAYAYNISGGVEFSYTDYETKTGDVRTSSQSWTQLYRAGIGSYLLDPRFMRYNAGIGYSIYSRQASPDVKTLDYDLNAAFFPGMKYNWDVYGRKSTTTINSSSNIAGATVETTGYGGTLYLNFSKGGGSGRNNNNNNNNNNSFSSRPLVLPDISLSRNHTESNSLSSSNPLNESLDSTRASGSYRPIAAVAVDFNAGLEEYQNIITQSSYDNKTSNLSTVIAVTPDAELRINGRTMDRITRNMTGFDMNEKTLSYDVKLDFKEKNKVRHYYSYNFTNQRATGADYTTQNAMAGISYRLSDSIQAMGEAGYSVAEYTQLATITSPEQKNTMDTSSILAGVQYGKQYTPDFLGPFALHTNYGFRYGYANYTSPLGNGLQGDGSYYTNSANVGINSRGWTKESLSLDYNYNNKRDQSPAHNMMETQSYSMNFTSQRISRTSIRALASYVETENKSEIQSIFQTNQFVAQQFSSQRIRYTTYSLSADFAATNALSLSTGASRGEAKNTNYTLSTLTPNLATQTTEDLVYAGANFTYMITRNMQYRASVRDENRHTQTSSIETYRADMYLDYRIRKVFVNFETRWQEDMPKNALKTQQQYYFVKVSRPF